MAIKIGPCFSTFNYQLENEQFFDQKILPILIDVKIDFLKF